jgi:hypothetical protein
MPKRRRTPQEKKVLSYAKDCRNAYGENDKSARKVIPRRKQQQRQNERRVLKAKPSKEQTTWCWSDQSSGCGAKFPMNRWLQISNGERTFLSLVEIGICLAI